MRAPLRCADSGVAVSRYNVDLFAHGYAHSVMRTEPELVDELLKLINSPARDVKYSDVFANIYTVVVSRLDVVMVVLPKEQ
jgi:hypothetical protein